MKRPLLAILLATSLSAADSKAIFKEDVPLRAMADELARAKTLQLNNLDKPYFVEYTIDDSAQLTIVASLGGILSSREIRLRAPRWQVRVGSYELDNTNSIYSVLGQGGPLPIDDDYLAIRDAFWLMSDGLYKNATDQMTRKRNTLREVADPDKTPDFAHAPQLVVIDAPADLKVNQSKWEEIARRASAGFANAPSVTESSVRVRIIESTYRLLNSEGTIIRIPQQLADVTIRAEALAPDGSNIWNYRSVVGLEAQDLPSGEEIERMAAEAAAQTESLVKAPRGEDYTGPVLFEQEAAAQLIAATLPDAVRQHRKPVAPPNSDSGQILEGVWATKMGAKVLPDWLSVIDDPLKRESRGKRLAGYYTVDDEGVAAERVVLVEKGTLKNFLASRQPVRNIDKSNGHGRLPGAFAAEQAVPGNLFVEATQTVKEKDMKAQLLNKVKAAGLKYGLLIRRLDFPSTAGMDELQSMGRQLQKSGVTRTLNPPLLAYRVYLDGHEELVRGLRFKDFSAKDLRDLSVASDQPYAFNYVYNGTGFNHVDAGSEATTCSVVAPSLMFDSMELAKAETEGGKLPIVPAPALVAQQ